MSEQNTTSTSVEMNGTEDKFVIKSYDTYEECAANKPPSAKADAWKVIDVYSVKRDKTVYVWGFTGITAVNLVAREDGYTASAHDSKRGGGGKKAVTQDAVAEWLKNATPEQRRALGLPVDPGTHVDTKQAAAQAQQNMQPAPKGGKSGKSGK